MLTEDSPSQQASPLPRFRSPSAAPPPTPSPAVQLLTNVCLIAVFYLNFWLGIALLSRSFEPPYSDSLADWVATLPSDPGRVPSKCEDNYEDRRFVIKVFCIVWLTAAFIQGSSLLTAIKIATPAQTYLATTCAVTTSLITLAMIGTQIFLVRRWMASPCAFTPLNSLETKMNRGFFVTQIVSVLVSWYVFTVWCKPFRPIWLKLTRKNGVATDALDNDRWSSCRSSLGSAAAVR
eukprot:Gregarina_sp_Pseudo_9__1391@NODE_1930_length_1246_cov_97_801160_g1790_i0_p1_GENE_NODE_1930_length_1246_cov_97_801160_g1790_i0NODE_1930_length_1246_cov_97_801160_g1790_i0_p1_ORF_typecomplete_len235_score30_47DUF1129/PF06570_11/6_3e02DUF1129/PF06570_11/0_0043Nitrate_red_gam/PF02665_14/6_7e03Nitrate_red_gam/PF02665_14/0_0079TMEM107/PF14995_6/2_3e03TMEM107/PF14995_6/0_029TMEM107/PF14995_6/3_1e03_NODE_1930_length_1246_cov_97_801160_g1790_i04921196